MAKISKKQLLALENILLRLERGQDFLLLGDVLVCAVKSHATTTLDYLRPSDDTVCTPINKFVGSDLALLHNGIGNLREFIKGNK